MRPVNLLPQGSRPYVASGGKGTRAYAVLGVLALLLVGAVAYVLTSNQISSRNGQISQANAERAQAEAKVSSLQSYGTFNQIATTRISTVAALAIGRIDYERLIRETARVLPGGVWLSSLDAEAGSGVTGSAPATTSSTSSTSGSSTGGPTVHLLGCAKTQDEVATTLVRLRAIHGSDEVDLNNSKKDIGQLAAAAANSDGGGSTGCGNNYSFDILVNLTPTTVTGLGDLGQKIPVSLGGGS